jgi:hypothetical protein
MTQTVGICVPTVREQSAREFLAAWTPHWRADASSVSVRVFLHEDRPARTFQPSAGGLRLEHTAHSDIDRELGEYAWIIPRGSGACRSFPMYLAWKAGCEYIVTLDDDCHPDSGNGERFLDEHLVGFQRDRWFRTIAGDEPRGIPYGRLGSIPVRINHGLWSDVPDLDGPTTLVRLRDAKPVTLRSGHDVIPPGLAFPLCAMNVCYHRSIIPAAYNLLMGLEAVGLDRFDDIWSGLLLKRVLDYMGWYATTGEPYVRHIKRSNSFTNLRKEALGIHIHEYLWDYILDAPLDPGLTVTGVFKALAERLREFPQRVPAAPCSSEYFAQLATAMTVWAGLFESAPA